MIITPPTKNNGGCYTLMDAGQAADLPEGVAGKRLPPWILPKVDNETRRKLRPDILIIEGFDSNTVPQENTNKPVKQEQHKNLVSLLRGEGWTID